MTRVRSSMSRAIRWTRRTRTAARILCRPAAAAANAQAVHIRIRTARAGGGATGNTRATLAAALGSRLGEEAVRGAKLWFSYLIGEHQNPAAWTDGAL